MKANLSKLPSYLEIGLNNKLAEIVLVLMGDDDEQFAAFGSGFFIAPGIVMTAKHVMEEYWRTYHPSRPFPKRKTETETRFKVWGMQYKGGMAGQGLWYSEKMWIADYTDIAFLYFKPYDDNAKNYKYDNCYELTMYSPDTGEFIASYGYPKTEIELTQRDPIIKVEYKAHLTRSIGKVLEVHERYTPENMYKFPCLETTTRFDNGMSGGPVFNSKEQICGVVSGGSGQDGFNSFVALIWPAMLAALEKDDLRAENLNLPQRIYDRFFELFDKNFIRQTGWREVFPEKFEQFEEYIDEDDYARIRWIDEKIEFNNSK